MNFARALGCGVAWLLAFGLVSAVLDARAPFPEVPVAAPKLAHLAQHREDFDALFIGSSRVQFQVMPAIFDQAAATHSFNLGVAGMVPPESLYFARCVLALRLPRLKWLFIELADLDPVIDTRNASSARAAYWHDARHTSLAIRDLWSSSRPTARKLEILAAHARLFATRAAGIGRGAALLAPRFTPPARKEKRPAVLENGGFSTVTTPPLTPDQLGRIRGTLDEMHSRPWPLVPLRPAYREALLDLAGEIRRAGVEPVFFIAPNFNWRDRLAAPDAVRLLTFHDEARHAALLDPRHFADTVHLNATGAALFSRALAEEFTAGR